MRGVYHAAHKVAAGKEDSSLNARFSRGGRTWEQGRKRGRTRACAPAGEIQLASPHLSWPATPHLSWT